MRATLDATPDIEVVGEAVAGVEAEAPVTGYLLKTTSLFSLTDALGISVNTVAQHVSHLLGKLGCKNRVEAAVRAVKAGWLRWI